MFWVELGAGPLRPLVFDCLGRPCEAALQLHLVFPPFCHTTTTRNLISHPAPPSTSLLIPHSAPLALPSPPPYPQPPPRPIPILILRTQPHPPSPPDPQR